MAHLDAEYQLLQPELLEQNRSMEICRGKIVTAQEACRACAIDRCQWDIGDWIIGGLDNIGDWFHDFGNKIVDWKGWRDMGDFFGKIDNWFQDAKNSLVNWKGFSDMANFFGRIGNAFSSGFNSIKNTLGNAFSSGFTSVKNTLGNVGNKIGSGIKSIGSFLSKGFGKLLGRRRRSVKTTRLSSIVKRSQHIDERTKKCMQRCHECQPFLGDQTTLIRGVCGNQILADQEELDQVIAHMQALYKANGNPLEGTDPIVSKIEFDETDFSVADFSMGGVYVTANTPTGVFRYASKYRYNVQYPQTTADELAQELIDMWNR
ncbi:uncharacterized protein LOC132748154 [Ruditapes philippinarum]|uniref:uncharacterized protein LOC132748154 n=1 Tax=Ruditapes philippinarum TaxID=129788 RepID=UPI00295B8169|nr:uncharacterized protein LOC132748154 [Ruditapes philippinarum]